jgi:hypothetical protein
MQDKHTQPIESPFRREPAANGERRELHNLGSHLPTAMLTGKVIDWEAFHYGMLDHKFLNDPNPAKADHRRTIYELWVGELIQAVFSGAFPVYSKDGKLPRRLAAAQGALHTQAAMDADVLIGCLFESQRLLDHMEAYFNEHKEVA